MDPIGKGGHGRLLLWVVCRAAMGPMMSVTGSACQGGGPRLRSLRTLTKYVPARTALYVLGLSSPLSVVSCLCKSLAAGSWLGEAHLCGDAWSVLADSIWSEPFCKVFCWFEKHAVGRCSVHVDEGLGFGGEQ